MFDIQEVDDVAVEREEETVTTQQPGFVATEQTTHDIAAERRLTWFQITRALWTILSTLEILLVIRFILKLISANPGNSFAEFMYKISAPFVTPFANLIGNPSSGGTVLEVTTLIALAIYALFFWILVRVLRIIFDRPSARTITRTTREQLPDTGTERVTQITRKD
jgi:uncharacterized protein YggT (Ycf19 family)